MPEYNERVKSMIIQMTLYSDEKSNGTQTLEKQWALTLL